MTEGQAVAPPAQANSDVAAKAQEARAERDSPPTIQRQIEIGSANDPLEAEADAAADSVMSGGTAGAVSSASSSATQAKGDAGGMDTSAVEGAIGGGGGAPLPDATRGQMEAGFGSDLGGVRVHSDSKAAGAAASINAEAFTTGNDIYMGSGRYNPGTPAGDKLLAHEITHTIQQKGGGGVQRKLVQANFIQREGGETKPETKPEVKPEETPAKAGPSPVLEATIRKIEHAYSWICLKQRDAVADLAKDAEKTDPPPLWQTLLIAAAELALTVAMGGVGGIIAKSIGKKLVGKVTEMVAEGIAKGVADGAKDTGKKLVKAAASGIFSSSGTSTEGFWRGLRDALTDTAKAQQAEFIDREQKLRDAPDGEKQALALLSAIDSNYDQAYGIQGSEALDKWCVYQAQTELGTSEKGTKNEGTNLGKQLGDTSAKGVLGIVIEVGDPGDKPTILRAEIEGLNEGLRKNIENRPIGELKIPITVKGEVGPQMSWLEEVMTKRDEPNIYIGRNEAGTVWMSNMSKSSANKAWLSRRGGSEGTLYMGGYNGRTWREYTDAAAFKGARMVIEEDLKGQTVAGKLSG